MSSLLLASFAVRALSFHRAADRSMSCCVSYMYLQPKFELLFDKFDNGHKGYWDHKDFTRYSAPLSRCNRLSLRLG